MSSKNTCSGVGHCPKSKILELNDISVKKHNVPILKNCIKILSDSTHVGSEIINDLEKQGEQFCHISEDVHGINESLKRSSRVIRGMKSWWGAFLNRILPSGKGSFKYQEVMKLINKNNDPKCDNIEIDNVKLHKNGDIDDEENKYLDEISSLLLQLKDQNSVITGQLTRHNEQIDNIDSEVSLANSRIKTINRDIRKIT